MMLEITGQYLESVRFAGISGRMNLNSRFRPPEKRNSTLRFHFLPAIISFPEEENSLAIGLAEPFPEQVIREGSIFFEMIYCITEWALLADKARLYAAGPL